MLRVPLEVARLLGRLSLIFILSALTTTLSRAQGGTPLSLCRLAYTDICEPVPSETQLSERQKEFFREWANRYHRTRLKGEAVVLAFSDLPQAIRHALFLEDGRPLAQTQVRERLLVLSRTSKGHPVLEAILSAMPAAFGNEARFYSGLELAIHHLLVSNPGAVATLRKGIQEQLSHSMTAATKTTPAPQPWAPTPRETARAD